MAFEAEYLLRILDSDTDTPALMDQVLHGRMEQMRLRLIQILREQASSRTLDLYRRLDPVSRARVLVSAEFSEWFADYAYGDGHAEPSLARLENMLQREWSLRELHRGRVTDELAAYPDPVAWSPLGDWRAERHGSQWRLRATYAIGDCIAVDADSPLARKHEARSGVLSQPYLEWTPAERERVQGLLAKALEKIDATIPVYGVLIRNFTRRIIVRKSVVERIDEGRGLFTSEHVPRQQGSIRMLNPQLPDYPLITCMERLLHESIHNFLAAYETMQGNFCSYASDCRPISPWSGNAIPNSSFIHAIFVYYACHRLFEQLQLGGRGLVPEREWPVLEQQLEHFAAGFLIEQPLKDQFVLDERLHPTFSALIDRMQERIRSRYGQTQARRNAA